MMCLAAVAVMIIVAVVLWKVFKFGVKLLIALIAALLVVGFLGGAGIIDPGMLGLYISQKIWLAVPL